MKHNINFSKKDVVVAFGCVVFLLAGLGAVGDGGRERAKRTVCLANLKQLTAALNMYADDNDSNLPLPVIGGYWLQDIEVKTVNFMLRAGLTRKMFYCPSNANFQKYNDLFWMYSNSSWNGKIFTNETSYVVSGYCYILQCSPVDNNGNKNNQYPRTPITQYRKDGGEKKVWLTTTQTAKYITRTGTETLLPLNPSTREMVIDSILGVERPNTPPYGYNFDQIAGGLFSQTGGMVFDRTSHLRGRFPAGGNIGFLDGHGEWRIFDPEKVSGLAIPRYGTSSLQTPSFFW